MLRLGARRVSLGIAFTFTIGRSFPFFPNQPALAEIEVAQNAEVARLSVLMTFRRLMKESEGADCGESENI